MDTFVTTMTSDLAIVLYDAIGLIVAIVLVVIFNKKRNKLESEYEYGADRKRYSDLENSLKNSKRR